MVPPLQETPVRPQKKDRAFLVSKQGRAEVEVHSIEENTLEQNTPE